MIPATAENGRPPGPPTAAPGPPAHMRIALIYAKAQNVREQAANAFADDTVTKGELARDEVYPPLGISILAAWLEKGGHEVRLKDDSIDDFDEIKKDMDWAEVVGVSALTPNARPLLPAME